MPRNESGVLAVRLLALLAVHPDGLVSSQRLGELLDANPVVVRRLIARLKVDGLVETRRGPGGGTALSREPASISLGRVHRALAKADGDPAWPPFAAAEAAYLRELDRWTVAQVMDAFPESRRNNESYEFGGAPPQRS
ncbi:MAG: Rrf2 family transcriptional regulator [Candidatus Limnocylindria bacterium]